MTLLAQTLTAMETEFNVRPNPREYIGANNPPEPTFQERLEAVFKKHDDIADGLYTEGKNWLDKPVETAEEAAAVAQLVNLARKAKTTADDERKKLTQVLDDQKNAAMAKFNLLTGDTKTVKGKLVRLIEAAGAALAPYLAEQKRIQEEEARIKREAAEKARREAEEAARAAAVYDLQAKEEAEALIQAADQADKEAKRAEKAKPQATGGGRAIGLRKVSTVEVVDYTAFAKHVWASHPADMRQALDAIAKTLHTRDKHAAAAMPGLKVEEKDAI